MVFLWIEKLQLNLWDNIFEAFSTAYKVFLTQTLVWLVIISIYVYTVRPVLAPWCKHLFCLLHFNLKLLTYFKLSLIMVWTRSQLEHLSNDELIDELMSIEDISSKPVNLTTRFDNFTRRFEILPSELAVSKNCNRLLSERIIQLERNAFNNAQYHRRESIEMNPVPASISNEELKDNVCKALSLSLSLSL